MAHTFYKLDIIPSRDTLQRPEIILKIYRRSYKISQDEIWRGWVDLYGWLFHTELNMICPSENWSYWRNH